MLDDFISSQIDLYLSFMYLNYLCTNIWVYVFGIIYNQDYCVELFWGNKMKEKQWQIILIETEREPKLKQNKLAEFTNLLCLKYSNNTATMYLKLNGNDLLHEKKI